MNVTKISLEKAQEVIEHLNGTCLSIEQGCADLDVDPEDFLDQHCHLLDDAIFNCEGCGWWFEQGEMADDPHDRWVCGDCVEGDEEDETD